MNDKSTLLWRSVIGVHGKQSIITGHVVGGLSGVPFVEPIYPTGEGFHSPYYTAVRVLFLRLQVS